jgi:IclR family acetate operon transcriptional repressor
MAGKAVRVKTLNEISQSQTAASPAPAVMRAVMVLDFMAKRRAPVTLGQITTATGMAKSTASNLMSALVTADMARRTEEGWVLGPRIGEWCESLPASTHLASEFQRLAAIHPVLSRETVYLGALDREAVVVAARYDGRPSGRSTAPIGHKFPVLSSSLGRAILAKLPAVGAADWAQNIGASHSTASLERIREDLDRVQKLGYAVDEPASAPGIACLSVAVPGRKQLSVGTTFNSARADRRLHKLLLSELGMLAGSLGIVA